MIVHVLTHDPAVRRCRLFSTGHAPGIIGHARPEYSPYQSGGCKCPWHRQNREALPRLLLPTSTISLPLEGNLHRATPRSSRSCARTTEFGATFLNYQWHGASAHQGSTCDPRNELHSPSWLIGWSEVANLGDTFEPRTFGTHSVSVCIATTEAYRTAPEGRWVLHVVGTLPFSDLT